MIHYEFLHLLSTYSICLTGTRSYISRLLQPVSSIHLLSPIVYLPPPIFDQSISMPMMMIILMSAMFMPWTPILNISMLMTVPHINLLWPTKQWHGSNAVRSWRGIVTIVRCAWWWVIPGASYVPVFLFGEEAHCISVLWESTVQDNSWKV
jgi:hypothetical protein